MGLRPEIQNGERSPVYKNDVTMTLRYAHDVIKAWEHAHDREIDHESIFTLKGYP